MRGKRTELAKNTHNRSALKATSGILRICIKKAAVLVMSTALITYPIDFSYVHAYFTDKVQRGSVELSFDIYRFTENIDLNVDFLKGILVVTFTLPEDCAFTAEDIISDSIELFYDDKKIYVTPKHTPEVDGRVIKVTYDWDEIEKVIDDDNSPKFELSGKGEGAGVSGLGERFIFRGQGEIVDLDWEFFSQMDWPVEIKSEDEIEEENKITVSAPGDETQSPFLKTKNNRMTVLVPMNDETITYSFKFFVNGKQMPDDEVEWSLSSDIPGVSFRSGKLIVSSSAESGEIVIYAELKSNRYFAASFPIKIIKPEIELPPELQLPVDGQMPVEPIPGLDGETPSDGTGKTEPGKGTPTDGTGENTSGEGTLPGEAGGDKPGDENNDGDGGIDESEGEIKPPINPPEDGAGNKNDGSDEGDGDKGSEDDEKDTQNDEEDKGGRDEEEDTDDQSGEDDGTTDDRDGVDQPGDSGDDDEKSGNDNGSEDDPVTDGDALTDDGDKGEDDDQVIDNGTSLPGANDNDEDGSDNDGADKNKEEGMNKDEVNPDEGLDEDHSAGMDYGESHQGQETQVANTVASDAGEQIISLFDTS